MCEEGYKKYAEKIEDEEIIYRGRRKMAVYGENAHCKGVNTCKVEEEQPAGFAGPIAMFWDCLDLDSFEINDVTTHYDGDQLEEDISMDYCYEYTFHCGEETVDCKECVSEFS